MRFLKTIDVLGQKYRIYRKNLAEMPDDEGECDYDKHHIYLREGCSVDVLQHELRHAYWHHSGIGTYFAELTGLRGKKLADAEERFIRLDTPACLLTWRAAGLLRGRRNREIS